MRTVVAAVAVLVLCLVLGLSQTPASLALSNVDDAEPGGVPSAVLLQASTRGVFEAGESVGSSPRRSLKQASKKAKARGTKTKAKKAKWAAGQPAFLATVITVAIIVTIVVLFVVFLLITEKKKQDPKWRVRDLFKRRLRPGVKRTLTRRFTRKSATAVEEEEVEKPKLLESGAPPITKPVEHA